jgi:hypothetical protein
MKKRILLNKYIPPIVVASLLNFKARRSRQPRLLIAFFDPSFFVRINPLDDLLQMAGYTFYDSELWL